jgi:dCMP deaminase
VTVTCRICRQPETAEHIASCVHERCQFRDNASTVPQGPVMDDHDRWAMRVAVSAKQGSPDPSTKVGAVVYRPSDLREFEVISGGCNHFPTGTPIEWWTDREKKYAHVIHAEAAALFAAGRATRGAAIAVTSHPCVSCATLIVEAGIRRAVFPARPWRDDPAVIETCRLADEVFARAGMEIVNA